MCPRRRGKGLVKVLVREGKGQSCYQIKVCPRREITFVSLGHTSARQNSIQSGEVVFPYIKSICTSIQNAFYKQQLLKNSFEINALPVVCCKMSIFTRKNNVIDQIFNFKTRFSSNRFTVEKVLFKLFILLTLFAQTVLKIIII